MPDKVKFKESGITIEAPLEPAGPHELADMMVILRHESSFGGRSQLSDAGVHKLLEIAFYPGIRSDEGRFPRLSITAGERDDSPIG